MRKIKILCIANKIFLISILIIGLPCLATGIEMPLSYIHSDIGSIDDDFRETQIFYHNHSIDQLWYGTNRWAVRYDISGYAAMADSFTVQSLNIYFPNSAVNDVFSVSLFSDRVQPLDSLLVSYNQQTYLSGWNSIQLTQPFSGKSFWMVVDYETDSSGKYMAASAVGGRNSFFWIPQDGTVPAHFANMQQYNIQAEFLMSLGGILHFQGFDLELSDFSFQPPANIRPGGQIYSRFTIKNNSSQIVDSVVGVNIQLTNAANEPVWNITIPLDLSLSPATEITVTANEPFHTYRMPGFPSQYRLRAELLAEQDLYIANNIVRFSFNTFREVFVERIIETFVSSSDNKSLQIIPVVNSFVNNTVSVVNMFFNQHDPYYCSDAIGRKDYYQIGGYPFTVFQGTEKIAGYSSSYQSGLEGLLDKEMKTFLVQQEITTKKIDPDDMQLQFKFKLKNPESHIFPDYLRNLRFYAALVEAGEMNNLVKLFTTTDILDSLTAEGSETIQVYSALSGIQTHNPDGINPANLGDFRLVYWIQNTDDKKIYFKKSLLLSQFEFGEITSVDIPVVESRVRVFPNPVRSSEKLNIVLENNFRFDDVDVKIFNIRGQLIRTINNPSVGSHLIWDSNDEVGDPVSAGIYFIRINASNLNIHRKVLIIR